MAQCGPKTQVVYIGDGIVTTGDADPVAFVKRLRRMAEGKARHVPLRGRRQQFRAGRDEGHRGDRRRVVPAGERIAGPAAVAMELLGEITQPVLRDVRVEFRGLRTARVYPDPLPNLPLGTQQIILGRYCPQLVQASRLRTTRRAR